MPVTMIDRKTRRAVGALARLCVHARHDFAFQREGGKGYYRCGRALTTNDLLQHLAGEVTLGCYLIRPSDQTVRFIVFDIDLRAPERDSMESRRSDLLSIAGRLRCGARDFECELIVVDSGRRGLHLYILFSKPVCAKAAVRLADAILHAARLDGPEANLPDRITIERYPKSDHIEEGKYGSLLKLPLALHRGSGRRALFLGCDLKPVSEDRAGQLDYLIALKPTPVDAITFPEPNDHDQSSAPLSSGALSGQRPGVAGEVPGLPGGEGVSMQAVLRLIRLDPWIRGLFFDVPKFTRHYDSRSECEMALCTKLLRYMPPAQVHEVMAASAIGKWGESANYRHRTMEAAKRYIASQPHRCGIDEAHATNQLSHATHQAT